MAVRSFAFSLVFSILHRVVLFNIPMHYAYVEDLFVFLFMAIVQIWVVGFLCSFLCCRYICCVSSEHGKTGVDISELTIGSE